MAHTVMFIYYIIMSTFAIVVFTVIIHYYALYKAFTRYGIRSSISLKRYLNKFCKLENHILHDYKLRVAHRGDRLHGRFEYGKPIIVVQDAAFVKEMFSKHFECFLDRTDIEFERDVEPFKASSLYNMKAEDWKAMRPKLCHGFAACKVKGMVPLISKAAQQSIMTLRELFGDNEYHEMDIRNLSLCMVNELMAACVFGKSEEAFSTERNHFYILGNFIAGNKLDPKFRNPFLNKNDSICPKVLNKPTVMEHALRFFTETVEAGIRARATHRTQNTRDKDMLQFYADLMNEMTASTSGTVSNAGSMRRERKIIHDMLQEKADRREFGYSAVSNVRYKSNTDSAEYRSQTNKNKKRITWSYGHFALQASSFYEHGYKPVAMAVTFALHELALNPECQIRLVAEIMDQNSRHFGNMQLEHLEDMVYMDLVVSETLRKWPPVPYLKRVCTDEAFDMENPGTDYRIHYMVQKGQTVWVPIFAIHRDPKFYKDPHKFIPERFNKLEFGRQHLLLGYNPFGTGPRNCLGAKLALVQIKVLLYYFLLNLEVAPSSKTSTSSMPCGKSSELRLEGGHSLRIKNRTYYTSSEIEMV